MVGSRLILSEAQAWGIFKQNERRRIWTVQAVAEQMIALKRRDFKEAE